MSKAAFLPSTKRDLHLITDRGRALLAQNPATTDNAFLAQFGEIEAWRERAASGTGRTEGEERPLPDSGVFVTTSDFSREARDYISRVQHRIVLIDGQRFAHLLIQHGVGVRVRATYTIQTVDEDYFA